MAGAMSKIFDSAGSVLGNGASKLGQYKIVLFVILGLAILFGIGWFLSVALKKKNQWTHTIEVQRLFNDGSLSKASIHRARRFVPEKGVELFELEKPILGSYLLPQPGAYTSLNTFSIVLDEHNRIYTKKKTTYSKDKESEEVSIVHAGIDIQTQQMKDKWQAAHKQTKKLDTLALIKEGVKIIFIIAMVIIGVTAIQEWGDNQQIKAQAEADLASAMKFFMESQDKNIEFVNALQLQITPMLNALYGKENVAGEVRKYCEGNSTVQV